MTLHKDHWCGLGDLFGNELHWMQILHGKHFALLILMRLAFTFSRLYVLGGAIHSSPSQGTLAK